MKVLLILALLSSPATIFAQGAPSVSAEPTPHASYLDFASATNGCAEGRQLAEKDIAGRRPYLLVSSGIAAIVYTTDAKFEQTFGVRYLDTGRARRRLRCCLRCARVRVPHRKLRARLAQED